MKECLFCNFVSGKSKEHVTGAKFRPLNQTKNTLSFLSVDLPANEDGHSLIIPKKHFESFEEIPKNIYSELLEHVRIIAEAIKKEHGGYNILLNNGKCAGQYVMHAHFHIIPRDEKDGITIENWRRKKFTKQEYNRIYDNLKKLI